MALQRPRAWPEFSTSLAFAMSGNGTSLYNQLLRNVGVPEPLRSDLARLAVTCIDSPPPDTKDDFPTPEELADIGMETIANVSRRFGMSVSISEPDGGCQFWPVRGPERFTGPWNHTLANPMLIVSNTVSDLSLLCFSLVDIALLPRPTRKKTPLFSNASCNSYCHRSVSQHYTHQQRQTSQRSPREILPPPHPELTRRTSSTHSLNILHLILITPSYAYSTAPSSYSLSAPPEPCGHTTKTGPYPPMSLCARSTRRSSLILMLRVRRRCNFKARMRGCWRL